MYDWSNHGRSKEAIDEMVEKIEQLVEAKASELI
jgi:hypothetical protein